MFQAQKLIKTRENCLFYIFFYLKYLPKKIEVISKASFTMLLSFKILYGRC